MNEEYSIFRPEALEYKKTHGLVISPCQRLTDIAVSPVEHDEEHRSQTRLNGHIVIRNLSFRHSPTEPNIFEGINIEVMPGESVAIIGPSGCGKSTFLHVLAGLYESTEGDIFINGGDDVQYWETSYQGAYRFCHAR